MHLIKIPNIGETVIDMDNVPRDYIWMDGNNIEEFESRNFLAQEINSTRFLVCSEENINALLDYYLNYVFHYDFLGDMQSILSPGYDLWIGYYERGKRTYSSLPKQIRQIVDYLIKERIIFLCKTETKGDDEEFIYVMKDGNYIANNPVSWDFISGLEDVCRKIIMEYWINEINDFWLNARYLTEPDCGEWGKSLYEMFLLYENPDEEGERDMLSNIIENLIV